VYGSLPSEWGLRRQLLTVCGCLAGSLGWLLLTATQDGLAVSEPSLFVGALVGGYAGSLLGRERN
jgi:uncharacterized membrane protein YjjB (DUF3815 family)